MEHKNQHTWQRNKNRKFGARGSSQKAKKFATNDISTDEKVTKEKVIYRQVNQPEFLWEK